MSALTNETKLRIEKTIKNLKANKMDAYYCENKTAACNLVKTLIKKGDVISSGGSVTLAKPFRLTHILQAVTLLQKTASYIMWTVIQIVLPQFYTALRV